MSSSPRLLKRSVALCLPLALSGAACVHQAPPGVRISALQSSIVFGVKLPNKDVTPPGATPPAATEGDTGLSLPPQPEDTPLAKPPSPPLPTAPRIACPSAREDAFPDIAAPQDVSTVPEAGTYLWKQSGTYLFNGLKLSFNPFGHRTVSNVSAVTTTHYPVGDSVDPTKPADETEFTFKVKRPDPAGQMSGAGDYFVDTFQVRQTPLKQNTTSYQGSAVGAGDPERGLTLKSTEQYNKNGSLIGTFAPDPGVLFLPLPVISDQQFQAVGVDPLSGATMSVSGTVGARKQIDACGTVLSAWEVPMTVNFTSPNGSASTTTYTIDVATQMGCMIIAESYAGSNGVGGPVDQSFTIGELHPGEHPQ